MQRFAAVVTLLLATIVTADARPMRSVTIVHCDDRGCSDARQQAPVAAQRAGRVALTEAVGSRPAVCPRRWCGCGASLHLFGRVIPRLNLAANWLAFPRAAPAPDMAAARRGHVFVLKQHIEGKIWLVYDANSGGGKARMHARSISGFTIVNPRAA